MKTIRYYNEERDIKVLGFTNNWASYGKVPNGKYKLELHPIIGYTGIVVPLYLGKKKPIFRNLTVIKYAYMPLSIIVLILLVIGFILFLYIEGAMRFITDSADQTSVREFNWINIAIIIVLTILLIVK